MPDNLNDYASKYGMESVVNDYGEIRQTYVDGGFGRIIFPNGWCASIIQKNNGVYSVAPCDYNGWFDWDVLNEYGGHAGCFYCHTEKGAIDACEIIRSL